MRVKLSSSILLLNVEAICMLSLSLNCERCFFLVSCSKLKMVLLSFYISSFKLMFYFKYSEHLFLNISVYLCSFLSLMVSSRILSSSLAPSIFNVWISCNFFWISDWFFAISSSNSLDFLSSSLSSYSSTISLNVAFSWRSC